MEPNPKNFQNERLTKKSFPLHFPKSEDWHKSTFGILPKKQKWFNSHLRANTKWGFLAFLRLILFPKNGFGTVWFLGLGRIRADPAWDLLGVGRSGADRACQDALYLWVVNLAGNKFSGEYMLFYYTPQQWLSSVKKALIVLPFKLVLPLIHQCTNDQRRKKTWWRKRLCPSLNDFGVLPSHLCAATSTIISQEKNQHLYCNQKISCHCYEGTF